MKPRLRDRAIGVALAAAGLATGSARADFWESTAGPYGGYVRRLLVLSPDTLVAGTDHHGVYRSGLPTSDAELARSGAALWMASRPNPSRTAVQLQFALPHAGHLRLDVYDVAGRAVRCLWDAPANAGAQSVTWDGRDSAGHRVPAGVYLTRLVTGTGVHAARIVRVE